MTFDEAKIFKAAIGDNVAHSDVDMRVFVVPANPSDFSTYCTWYRVYKKTDELAKNYSLDNNFEVYGLWTDGVDVLYKKLS